jgi:carboxyl-terminal processing protease
LTSTTVIQAAPTLGDFGTEKNHGTRFNRVPGTDTGAADPAVQGARYRANDPSAKAGKPVIKAPRTAGAPSSFFVNKTYATQILHDVDKMIAEQFYSEKLAKEVWPQARERHRAAIENSKDLTELSNNINAALKELKSSHTQFVTINDETYYFLLSLFYRRANNFHIPEMAFTGAITGGVDCTFDQVRYVLDSSPAQEAGVKIGDQIVSVAGKPFIGQLSFEGHEGKNIKLVILRDGAEQTLSIKPVSAKAYPMYVKAIAKSIKTYKHPEGKIGYIHLWSGGSDSHEQWEEELYAPQLQNTDALIIDFRDGYGGNGLDDLDYFYRSPKAYPNFNTVNRRGKQNTYHMYYDKPVVALINGGVRSGKELISYSLKETGRAKLVGQKTAGSVLAGSVFPLGGRAALYVAVASGTVNGVTLEGNGVEPDVPVPTTAAQRGSKDVQFLEAERMLREVLKSKAAK